MKKKLQILMGALLLGGVLACLTYQKFLFFVEEETVSKPKAYQIGVYKNYENARKKATSIKGAIILNKNDSYQVIAAIAKSTENQQKIEQLLNREQISYYKKEFSLPATEEETLNDYESMMKQTDNLDTLKLLNQKLLQTLQERMN